jgi:hypothetical protein
VILAWLASNLAGAACGPVPASELFTTVDQAVGAFGADGFGAAADQTWSKLPCLSEAASPSLAVSLHAVKGLQLSAAGDDLMSQRSFGAIVRIDPAWVPPGTAIAPLLDRARTSDPKPGPSTPMKLPGFVIQVDGKPTGERPVDGPYLLQILDPKGQIELTQYVAAGEDPAIPREVRALASANASMQTGIADLAVSSTPLAYTATRPPTDGFGGSKIPESSRGGGGGGGGSKALLWSGVASGGLAAGLYGTAVFSRLSYDRGPSAGSYLMTNGSYFGSIGTASLSGLLFTTYLITK